MAATEKQKQSLYFPEEMLREIMAESTRLDRSLSWTVQQAWRIARGEVQRFPTALAPRTSMHEQAPGSNGREARPSAEVLEFLRGKFERDAIP